LTELRDWPVPSRYTLTGRFWFIDYGCKKVFVDKEPTPRTTVSIVGAEFSERDGVKSPGLYILAHATNNSLLAQRYSAVGLPTVYQPKTTSSDTESDTSSIIDWTIVGNGLDHTIHAETTEPTSEPLTSTALFYFDSPDANLRLTFANSLRQSTARVSADFTTASALSLLFTDPIFQTIPRPGAPCCPSFPFRRGEWTSIIEGVA
jgi:hypothetical protein